MAAWIGFSIEKYFRISVTCFLMTKPVAVLGVESHTNPIVVGEVSVSNKVRGHFGPICPRMGDVSLAERI